MNFYLDTLLNLPNLTVESCTQSGQQIVLKLRLLNEESDCPHCQKPSDKLHQNRPVLIRDLPISGRFVHLKLPRRQFYCSYCQRYFTERLSFVDWERRYTQRYENAIYQRVQATNIEQISREEDLRSGSGTRDFQTSVRLKKKANWGEVKRLSIDEISQRKGHQDFVTVVCDIDRGQLLEVIDSHQQEDIIEVLRQQPIELRSLVEEVSVDMWGGFPKVVQEVFPNASVGIRPISCDEARK